MNIYVVCNFRVYSVMLVDGLDFFGFFLDRMVIYLFITNILV